MVRWAFTARVKTRNVLELVGCAVCAERGHLLTITQSFPETHRAVKLLTALAVTRMPKYRSKIFSTPIIMITTRHYAPFDTILPKKLLCGANLI